MLFHGNDWTRLGNIHIGSINALVSPRGCRARVRVAGVPVHTNQLKVTALRHSFKAPTAQ